jgi:hypothetical protein
MIALGVSHVASRLVGLEHPQLMMFQLVVLGEARGQEEFDVGDGLGRATGTQVSSQPI